MLDISSEVSTWPLGCLNINKKTWVQFKEENKGKKKNQMFIMKRMKRKAKDYTRFSPEPRNHINGLGLYQIHVSCRG